MVMPDSLPDTGRQPPSFRVGGQGQPPALFGDCNAGLIRTAAEQRHAVRHAARRRELRQRMLRIGRPVAARLGHLDEPGAQRQRRMAGEVRDRQHLVAQRRHEQQIDLEKTRAISSRPCGGSDRPARNRPPRGSAPAEQVRPRVGHLHLQLSSPPLSVSSSNAPPLRRTGRHQRAVRPVGQLTSTGTMPSFFTVSSAARSTSVAGLSFIHAGK
jgi:hypothetical protein